MDESCQAFGIGLLLGLPAFESQPAIVRYEYCRSNSRRTGRRAPVQRLKPELETREPQRVIYLTHLKGLSGLATVGLANFLHDGPRLTER
jgi:hypothetical protein